MCLRRSVKALRKRVQVAFRELWSAGFRVLGHLLRPRLESWSSPGGRRVLVVAPHPDDEVAGCGGAILAHRRRGDRVRVAVATDGRRSQALGLDAASTAAARLGEMEAAAAHLGVELEWLGLPEGDWRVPDLGERLADVLTRFRPRTIYAPSRVDFHPEHEKVARALGRALAAPPTRNGSRIQEVEIRIYAVQVPLTPRLANLAVAVDLEAPRLIGALRAHHSQRGSLERCLRRRRYAGRLYRIRSSEEEPPTGAAETFWRLTPEQYQQIHQRPPDRPLHRTFRGLRYGAWSDPLAYLWGLGERRRLARSAS